MRTTLLLNQHKKCSCILEMIAKCDQRIADYRRSINFHSENDSSDDTIGFYYERWQITLAIKERLASAYSRTLTNIVKPTVDKILQTS